MDRAIFLDRDGTINEDIGYLYTEDKLLFIKGAIEALKFFQREYLLFIITNQPGIGRKVFSKEDFFKFNKYYLNYLKQRGVSIKKLYFCPHTREQNCKCHKPSIFFLKEAEKEYNINLKGSYVIGDHPGDIEMANMAGTKSIYLLSGHGKRHLSELTFRPDFIAEDIVQARIFIADQNK